VIHHRPFSALGGAERDWLKAKLHFAFSGMGNPGHTPIGPLMVWNDDEFAPSSGFPLHPHKNVEIITYVRSGAITHEDSLGNKARTAAGNVQVMSAGSGIRHSEMNYEPEPTLLYQIWISPKTVGGEPRWQNREFPKGDRSGKLIALASGYAEDELALRINAEARVLGSSLAAGEQVRYAFNPGEKAYLVTTVGTVVINGMTLAARDGAAVESEEYLDLSALEDTEVLVVITR
jgi:redox-sensitive bicupin YhaK (pirin superfamily)